MNMQSNKIEKEAKMDQESTGLITVDGVAVCNGRFIQHWVAGLDATAATT